MYEDKVYIKIMAEYTASPVWNINGSNMEISDYKLAPEIAERLAKWASYYQDYDEFDNKDAFDLVTFAKEGEQIARHIKAANPDWTVMYYDEHRFNNASATRPPLVEIK